jgi:putative FmdB family regulatory protein
LSGRKTTLAGRRAGLPVAPAAGLSPISVRADHKSFIIQGFLTIFAEFSMPIYAYRCDECGFAKDVLQKMSDPVLTVCLSCGKPSFKKQVTAAGFQLKGTGWYATDFRGGSKPPTGTASAPAEGAAPAAGSATTAAPAAAPAGDSTPAAAAKPAAPTGGSTT